MCLAVNHWTQIVSMYLAINCGFSLWISDKPSVWLGGFSQLSIILIQVFSPKSPWFSPQETNVPSSDNECSDSECFIQKEVCNPLLSQGSVFNSWLSHFQLNMEYGLDLEGLLVKMQSLWKVMPMMVKPEIWIFKAYSKCVIILKMPRFLSSCQFLTSHQTTYSPSGISSVGCQSKLQISNSIHFLLIKSKIIVQWYFL